jgi:LPS-assembly lipoprotein
MKGMSGLGRRALVLGLVGATAGCGFHPLYAPGGNAGDAQLQSVYVEIIANRPGQLLRQALQQRLEGTDGTVQKRFVLTVSYLEAGAGLGIQTSSVITRTRDTGKAVWVLQEADPPGAKLTYGTVRSLDGYDILNNQFFYSDLAEEAVQRRLADAVADQIVQSLAVYFRAHPTIS